MGFVPILGLIIVFYDSRTQYIWIMSLVLMVVLIIVKYVFARDSCLLSIITKLKIITWRPKWSRFACAFPDTLKCFPQLLRNGTQYSTHLISTLATDLPELNCAWKIYMCILVAHCSSMTCLCRCQVSCNAINEFKANPALLCLMCFCPMTAFTLRQTPDCISLRHLCTYEGGRQSDHNPFNHIISIA